MTKHTFLPTTNVEASSKEYLIASEIVLSIIFCKNKILFSFLNNLIFFHFTVLNIF